MFAPIGFIPFIALASSTQSVAMDHWFAEAFHNIPNDEPGHFKRLKFSGWRVLHYWLLDHCLYQQPFPVFASEPTGRIVRLSREVFNAPLNLSNEEYDWDFDWSSVDPSRAGDLFSHIGRAPEEKDYLHEFMWPFVDNDTWHISIPDAEAIRTYKKHPYLKIEPAAKILQPLNGWALCVRESDAEGIRQYIEDLYCWDSLEESTNRGGRPRKREIAATAYQELFPEGHETHGKSWKEALRDVNEVTGGSYSIDTLRRGLRVNDSE